MEENIKEVANKLKNEYAKEWRLKNKEKIKAITKRYWENKAKKYLTKGELNL